LKLIVGLGNPGRKYSNTRHNCGFIILDMFADKKNIKFSKEKFGGIYAEYLENNEKVILLKPQKFINLSGEVVKAFVNYYKIDIRDILIVVDDVSIDKGKYKLKQDGSSGGHNGLKDIENNLETNKYKRLKIGIGKVSEIDVKDYVLGKIKDKKMMANSFLKAVEIVGKYPIEEYDKLMNDYNSKG